MKLECQWFNYAKAFQPTQAQVQQYLAEITQTVPGISPGDIAGLSCIPVAQIKHMIQGTQKPNLTQSRILWILWALLCQPEPQPLSDLKSIATWGYMRYMFSVVPPVPPPVIQLDTAALKAIAQASGYSLPTVKKALQHDPRYSAKSILRVTQLARKMGFLPTTK